MVINNFYLIYSALFGACIGSFLNVCILRIPRKVSIVFPPSACPKCNYKLKWYDNIPVLSYISLLGKCRNCREKISVQYPVVEIISGFFGYLCVLLFSISFQAFFVFIFASALIVISFIDLEHKIIPDIISLPGIPIFFILALFLKEQPVIDLILGILTGGGFLYLIAFSYKLFTGKDGMGGGDVKLLAMIGGFIGYKGVFFTIFASSFIGTIIGVTIIALKGKDMKYAVPFGPFLSLGALLYIFAGDFLINLYFSKILGL